MPQCRCCKRVGSPTAVLDRRFPAAVAQGKPTNFLCDGCYYAPGLRLDECTHDGKAPLHG